MNVSECRRRGEKVGRLLDGNEREGIYKRYIKKGGETERMRAVEGRY